MAPAEADILSGALDDINAALGGGANTDLSTPQGQLAMSFTAALGDALDQILAVINGVDPARASGRLQDAVGQLYFISRKGATATVVSVVCSGASGTVIPAGTRIQDQSGYYYVADGEISIGASGSATGTFSCAALGAVVCPPNTVSIYQAIPGLTSVSNPTAGIIGSEEETRQQFEARRTASVEKNSVGSNEAIYGEVIGVSGVTDAYVTDNSADTALSIGGVSVAAHSLFVCVSGGTDDDVARSILRKKPPGCGYTGTTTVSISDDQSGYNVAPTYSVQFTRPTVIPIYFSITLKNSSLVPSSAVASCIEAITSVFNGDYDGQKERIGGTVFASRYYCAVAAIGSWVKIVDIYVGTSANPTGLTADMGIDQIPSLLSGMITVTLS
ncbi:baseplate J/gp47 family protein [Acetobacter sp.]|uniref:baseplate J/gp47 family protein n=1 Tax=Acetobacter sp. TaxID=440 RepID=UPI0039EC2865